MSKRSGLIYQLDNGQFGLAPNEKQYKEFQQVRKVFLELYHDASCTDRITDPATGKGLVALKSRDKLKLIGFSD